MEKKDVWEVLRSLFENDDGSLPEIVIGNLDKTTVEQIYNYLKSHSDPIGSDVLVWDTKLEKDVSLNSIEDPIDLLYRNRLPRVRVFFRNTSINGNVLPPIGCLITPSEVELDYRMGKEWNPDKVYSFLKMLAFWQSMKLDADISIPEEGEAPFTSEERKVFKETVQKLASEQR